MASINMCKSTAYILRGLKLEQWIVGAGILEKIDLYGMIFINRERGPGRGGG